MAKIDYRKAGVDVKKGEAFARRIKVARSGAVKAFGSLFELKPFLRTVADPVLVSSTDGVGTKLKLAQLAGIHHTVGIDLVAMNTNDIVCVGARPLFFLDYIACGKLDIALLSQVMRGIKKGLKDSQCSLIGGETAEMPGMYRPGEYDLAGFCVGIADAKAMIDARRITRGDSVIGIASSGLHSNGFSLVRKAFSARELKARAKQLLRPTRVYVKPILSLCTSLRGDRKALKGIAHVTGGAFYDKATKILPSGLGMAIDTHSWKPAQVFNDLRRASGMGRREMYSVFNMGIGMIVVVDRKARKKIVDFLNRFYRTYCIGEIVSSREKMMLR